MVRRLVVALLAVALMGATMVVGSPSMTVFGPKEASAQQQNVGGPTYCGPWQQAWYVSRGVWWYSWSWRWCYNPSLPPDVTIGGWYVDYAGWQWYGPAPPWLSPGFYYNGPPPY